MSEVKTETQEQQQTGFEQPLPAEVNEKMAEYFFGTEQGTKSVQEQTQQQETQKSDQPKIDEPKKEEQQVNTQTTDDVLDEDDFVKKHFGFDNVELAKKEIIELRKLKESATTKEEIKFVNEQSQKFFDAIKEGKEDDLYSYLSQKRTLEKIEKANLENAKEAADLIKTYYKFKYKDFSDYEIVEHFNENYEKPEKPTQSFEQSEDEYAEVLQKWQARMDAIDRKIIRDAKMVRPEFSQFKSEIVLPDIPKKENVQENKLSPEELETIQKAQTSFLTDAETYLNSFKGFEVTVKDKDVDLFTVNYDQSTEEKAQINSMLKEFVQSNFDANSLFYDRWVTKEKSLNANQMIKDLSRLFADDKASQKIANDAANRRLELYLKDKKNISLNTQQQTSTIEGDKSVSEQLQEFFWGQ